MTRRNGVLPRQPPAMMMMAMPGPAPAVMSSPAVFMPVIPAGPAKRQPETPAPGQEPEYEWFETCNNMYGALVNAGMRDGIKTAWLRFGAAALWAWLSQGTICLYIYGVGRDLCKDDSEYMWTCLTVNNQQICPKVQLLLDLARFENHVQIGAAIPTRRLVDGHFGCSPVICD